MKLPDDREIKYEKNKIRSKNEKKLKCITSEIHPGQTNNHVVESCECS